MQILIRWLLLVSVSGSCQAATLFVNATPAEFGCTLVNAIESINAGANTNGCAGVGSYGTQDTIVLVANSEHVYSQSYTPSGGMSSNNALPVLERSARILVSNGGVATIRANAGASFRFLQAVKNDSLDASPILRLKGLQFEDFAMLGNPSSSLGGGVISLRSFNSEIENCVFSNNTVAQSQVGGGAIYTELANLDIENSVFRSNGIASAASGFSASGGAIFASRSDLSVNGVVFDGNFANDSAQTTISNGGAISAFGASTSDLAQISITASTFINNLATRQSNSANGGALSINRYATVNIFDSSFFENSTGDTTSVSEGGAISAKNGKGLLFNIVNSTFTDNFGDTGGGFLAIRKDPAILATDLDNAIFVSLTNTIAIDNSRTTVGARAQSILLDGFQSSDAFSVTHSIFGSASRTKDKFALSIPEASSFSTAFINQLNGASVRFLSSDELNLSALEVLGPVQTIQQQKVRRPIAGGLAENTGIDEVVTFSFGNTLLTRPGCRGTEPASRLVSQAKQAYRTDQIGESRPIGSECDIGAVEGVYDDELCLPILTARGKIAFVCL